MEPKKSVVTVASYTGRTYESPNGTIHYHTISLADGTSGEYGSKVIDQTNFIIGQEVEYTYEANANPQYAGKIKKFYAQPMSGGGFSGGSQETNDARQKSIHRQVALKEAVNNSKGDDSINGILAVADAFDAWLNKLNPLADSGISAAPMQQAPPPVQVDANGIPF